MHHDEFIHHAVDVVSSADRASIESAWLASLATRDLLRRSVWPRYLHLLHLPAHAFSPSQEFHPAFCGVCGLREEVSPEDEAAYRTDAPWVRPIDAATALVAVEGIHEVADVDPAHVAAGEETLASALDAISALPAAAQLTELLAAVVPHVKGNKLERTALLETLGSAGILPVAGHAAWAIEFITWDEANSRMPRERFKRDWAYPVRFWTGADGVDARRIPRLG